MYDLHLRDLPDCAWTAQKKMLVAANLGAAAVQFTSAVLGTLLLSQSDTKVSCVAPTIEFQSAQLLAAPTGNGTNATAPVPQPFYKPLPTHWFSVGTLLGLVLFVYLTGAAHLVYLAQTLSPAFRSATCAWLDNNGANPLRWAEYAVTTTIMSSLGELAFGMTDAYLFLRNSASVFAIMMIGYAIEKLDGGFYTDAGEHVPRNKGAKAPQTAATLARSLVSLLWAQATVLNLTNTFIILYQLFASKTHTDVFYYNVVPYALLFQSFGLVAQNNFRMTRWFADPVHTELWYMGLSFGSKQAVFWLGFATYRGLEESRGFVAATPGVNWNVVRWVAAVLPLSLMLAVYAYENLRWSELKPDEQKKFAGKYARLRRTGLSTSVASPEEARDEPSVPGARAGTSLRRAAAAGVRI
jgi:hypothetical protein